MVRLDLRAWLPEPEASSICKHVLPSRSESLYHILICMQAVTLHTSHGDLKLELYCEEAPRTCENFLALCASDYYNGTVFHRHIPGFMLQGGDPTGTGQGGRSIYDTPSGKFADEIVAGLSHDRAGVVSMANSGPNTNGVHLIRSPSFPFSP
jgi:hypothetical protein